jgi:hypothetical protein
MSRYQPLFLCKEKKYLFKILAFHSHVFYRKADSLKTLDQSPGGFMANRSSMMLAILLILNPVMLLMFQNCSTAPKKIAINTMPIEKPHREPASKFRAE